MGTPSHSYHILTLRLPGNVERIVNDLRSELYSLTAAISTQALPPILPLAYVGPDIGSEIVSLLPQTEIPPLHIGPIGTCNETLILKVEMNHLWNEWLRGFAAGPAPHGMPAPLAGIFLGGTDLVDYWSNSSSRDDWLSLIDRSGGLPKRLSVVHIELMSLQTRTSDTWWDHLDWELRWSERIKLRGQAVTI